MSPILDLSDDDIPLSDYEACDLVREVSSHVREGQITTWEQVEQALRLLEASRGSLPGLHDTWEYGEISLDTEIRKLRGYFQAIVTGQDPRIVDAREELHGISPHKLKNFRKRWEPFGFLDQLATEIAVKKRWGEIYTARSYLLALREAGSFIIVRRPQCEQLRNYMHKKNLSFDDLQAGEDLREVYNRAISLNFS